MSLVVTPDGHLYLRMAQGGIAPWPLRGRVLLPWLCGQVPGRWITATWAGVALMAVGTILLAHSWAVGLAAGVMVAGLPMNRLNVRYPVLCDAWAMGWACVSAGAWVHGWYALSVCSALLAGLSKESAPVFAALYAWSPGPLVGLVLPGVLRCVLRGETDWSRIGVVQREAFAHPWRTGWAAHRDWWTRGDCMALPWGGALLGFAALSWQTAACLAVGYAQCLIATDTVRLYQWAAPPLCLAACSVVPETALPLLAASVVWNPWKGDGS